MMRERRTRTEGFTLVELLVALAILALLSLMGYRAVAALSDSEARLAEESDRWRTLDGFFTRLEMDAREAVPRDVRVGNAIEAAWYGGVDGDGNAMLRLSRAGPEFALEAGSGGQRIAYVLARNEIQVLYWPALDTPPGAAPERYSLVPNVQTFALAFLDQAGAWRAGWDARGELPRGMRATVQLASGERIERYFALH